VLAAASAGLALGLLGCARSSEERQLDDMRAEIERVQQDRDQADRETLDPQVADSRTVKIAGIPARAPAPSQPPPRVVNVGGDGETQGPDDESADTEDTSPRPTIRVLGSPRAGRGAWREDQVEQSNVAEGPGRSSALDPEAKPAYDAALALVNARQYDRALDALAAFLLKWPDHPYADNAMYWRGECYFAKGDYLHASEQFEGVVTRFPAGNKAPDALLKLGISHQKLGNPAKAKECFDRLAQTYPQSEAARHIPPVTVPAATPRGPASEDHR
jgi:tol-pal system protein YbgF